VSELGGCFNVVVEIVYGLGASLRREFFVDSCLQSQCIGCRGLSLVVHSRALR
jgi:hypothetical protein